MDSRIQRNSRGFALLAVLWVMVGVAALGSAATMVGRDAIFTARNRVNLSRAAWLAEGCLSRARVAIAEALGQEEDNTRSSSIWTSLDEFVRLSPALRGSDCDLTLLPAGVALDVNAATTSQLERLLRAKQFGSVKSDSLTAALLDWRDVDDIPRPLGAEASWYTSHSRYPPRNGPLADFDELARVRGFETTSMFQGVLDVEPGRIALYHAPREALKSAPGFTDEIVYHIEARRSRRQAVGSLVEIAGAVSSASRDSILAHFTELSALVTIEPDAWILTSRAAVGSPSVQATIEVRLSRAGRRAAVVRRRTWP